MDYGASLDFLMDAAAVPFEAEGDAPFVGRGLFSSRKTDGTGWGHAAPTPLGWEKEGCAFLLTRPDERLTEGVFLRLYGGRWRIASIFPQAVGGKTVYWRLGLEQCPRRKED